MNKILVEIYIPALMKTIEVFIPLKSKMYEVTQLVEAALREMSEGLFKPTSEVVLCEKNSGIIYNVNLTIEEIGLKNGSQLLLI